VEADIEVGGTDQLYNLLMGRDVMHHYGLAPQSVITYELLVGTDGVDKMAKSQGNYVGIADPPAEMFGKVMSIPDSALDQWWRLTLDRRPPDGDPMASKLALARGIVELYHDADAAQRGEDHFTRVVREGQAPEDVPEAPLPDGDPVHVPAVLSSAFGMSTSEARRLIGEGAVRVNGDAIAGLDLPRAALEGALVQAGKRRYVRLTAG
jgi:tyrosyl-tRNA synthetase